MNTTQANNLRVLADHMDGLKRTLHMQYYSSCGTPACALGEAGCVLEIIKQGLWISAETGLMFHAREVDASWQKEVTEKMFGLSEGEDAALFGMGSQNAWKRANVAGPDRATKAREILASHGYPAVVEVKEPDRIEEPSPHLTALLQRLTAVAVE